MGISRKAVPISGCGGYYGKQQTGSKGLYRQPEGLNAHPKETLLSVKE